MHSIIKISTFISFIGLNACATNTYQAYESEEFPIKMDLRGISKHTAHDILDGYFLSHQFNKSENSRVYFLPCKLKAACEEQLYTLVWTWDNPQSQQCNHGVHVLGQNSQYRFEHEPVRCN